MFKLKTKIKNKKKAQHIVEFALVVPIFIIIFSFILPYGASTYRHFQTTYLFMNAVSDVIENQPTDDTAASYIFADEIKRKMSDDMVSYIVEGEQNAYISGIINEEYQMLFNLKGTSYFNTLITINKAYVKPTILNLKGKTIKNDFNAYYETGATDSSPSDTTPDNNSFNQLFGGGYNIWKN